MRKRDFEKCLRAFVTEIESLQCPEFVKPDQWFLSTEILNAVLTQVQQLRGNIR